MKTLALVATLVALPALASAEVCNQSNDAERLACYDTQAGYIKPTVSYKFDEKFFAKILSKDSTELSRTEDFKQVKDRNVTFTGKVSSIDTPGWLSKDYQVALEYRRVSGYCYVKPEDKNLILKLKKGDTFSCTGPAKRYQFILGSGGVSMDHVPG
jgi:hypothetical protein